MKTALLSVYDKNGVVDFAKSLSRLGFNILASGGTARALIEAGVGLKLTSVLVKVDEIA